jgi:2-amino-4-hydroxy-6-hydroxymethyldihydropteridine diphosphokinase
LAEVFLGLGSNLGDREENIHEALRRLASHEHISLKQMSSIYETIPQGVKDQPDFLNAVVLIETDLDPIDLLDVVLQIEQDMGRVRNERWEPRKIDIDILLYDNTVMSAPDLTIPHPRMMERAFVMIPLAEIAPDLRLPGGKRASELADTLAGQGVRKFARVE